MYLERLNLSQTQITDAGLANLYGMKIGTLDVSRTRVTDAGLAKLRGIKSLQWLWLRGTRVTATG
jgi:hypothetical protein